MNIAVTGILIEQTFSDSSSNMSLKLQCGSVSRTLTISQEQLRAIHQLVEAAKASPAKTRAELEARISHLEAEAHVTSPISRPDSFEEDEDDDASFRMGQDDADDFMDDL